MGGPPKPIRTFTLCVALCCVLAPSCASESDAPSAPQDAAAGAAGADGEAEEAGVAGAGRPTSLGDSGASGDTTTPFLEAGEDGSGGAPGDLPDGGARRTAGGDTSQAGAGAEPLPSCGKQADGTICGGNMTPPASDEARFFCSSGEVIAEAHCPGACNVETNACAPSDGTGDGTGETEFSTLWVCRECYATQCRAALMACDADPRCVAHLRCFESCSHELRCYRTCDKVFADDALLGTLNNCVLKTGCVNQCQQQP